MHDKTLPSPAGAGAGASAGPSAGACPPASNQAFQQDSTSYTGRNFKKLAEEEGQRAMHTPDGAERQACIQTHGLPQPTCFSGDEPTRASATVGLPGTLSAGSACALLAGAASAAT